MKVVLAEAAKNRLQAAVAVVAALAGCSRATSTARDDVAAQTPLTTAERALAMNRTPTPRPAVASPQRVPVGAGALVVELRLAPARFMVHEPALAQLVFSVEGDGIEAEVFSGPSDELGRPPRFVVAFRAADGRVLPQPSAQEGMNGVSGYRGATPGDPVRQRLLLPTYAAELSPGTYLVSAETTVRVRAGAGAPWIDKPIAVELAVEVVADDDAAMGGVIDAIGARAMGTDYDDSRDATFQLERAHDARVVPWWIRLAEMPEYERRYHALNALGGWDDPRAVQALIRATSTAPQELPAEGYTTEALRATSAAALRHTAVQALGRSPRADALPPLLALRDSPDAEVRLNVLHRLARLSAAQARPHLEHFTHDTDATVSSEARRYLAELAR